MKTDPGAEEAHPGAMEAHHEVRDVPHGVVEAYPRLVQMEMVTLEMFVTVLKPWWLIMEAVDPPLSIKEANSEAVWGKMRAF
jgi:hypothetical protein